jgi:hypothetical protein
MRPPFRVARIGHAEDWMNSANAPSACVPAGTEHQGPAAADRYPRLLPAGRATTQAANALAEAHLRVTALGTDGDSLVRGRVVPATPPGPPEPAAEAVFLTGFGSHVATP